MNGEKNLDTLLKTMTPELNEGDYVFCSISATTALDFGKIIGSFKEKEGLTVILKKELADNLQLPYQFIAKWITLAVHSSLEAVGLTAAFSAALAQAGISCNVMAACYHDHIFVAPGSADKAMEVLRKLSVAW